jgi:hypothetical protein
MRQLAPVSPGRRGDMEMQQEMGNLMSGGLYGNQPQQSTWRSEWPSSPQQFGGQSPGRNQTMANGYDMSPHDLSRGMMLGGAMNHGNALQGAMGQMWQVNAANQQASLLNKQIGGGQGGGGGGFNPWAQTFGMNLGEADGRRGYQDTMGALAMGRRPGADLDLEYGDKMQEQKWKWQQQRLNNPLIGGLLSRAFGGGMGGGGFGYSTNFGASGSAI